MKKRYQKSELDPFAKLELGTLYGTLSSKTERLGSLKLTQSLDIDKFLRVLNRKEPPTKPLPPLMPGDVPRMAATPLPTTQELLRGWVDEWLDSGKNNYGGEDPRERNFKKDSGVGLAAYEFSKQGKIRLLPDSSSLALWLAESDKEPTGHFYPLIGSPPQSAEYAKEKLVFFLLSDLRFKLAKCRKDSCGKYFVLKHWNRLYKRGTVCESCQRSRSLESAVNATAESRRKAGNTLHQLAAKKFIRQILVAPDWPIDGKLKERIVLYLNSEIKRTDSLKAIYRDGITGRWLANAKNWNPIVSEARKLNRKSTERK
jgi:hypothetical protein